MDPYKRYYGGFAPSYGRAAAVQRDSAGAPPSGAPTRGAPDGDAPPESRPGPGQGGDAKAAAGTAPAAPSPSHEGEQGPVDGSQGPADGSGDAVAVDLEDLTARAAKADDYLALAQRTKADFENYRKRAVREAAAAQERGVAKLALELLPAVDNLDRALQAADIDENDHDETLVAGIRLVHADVIAALARAGIEGYSPEGEPFDPEHHEAVAQLAVPGAEPGTIVEVYQRGYRRGDAVLRPARVVVAG